MPGLQPQHPIPELQDRGLHTLQPLSNGLTVFARQVSDRVSTCNKFASGQVGRLVLLASYCVYRLCALNQHTTVAPLIPVDGPFRRILPVSARPGEGHLTEPIAGVQPARLARSGKDAALERCKLTAPVYG
jgi:hypothetical protein